MRVSLTFDDGPSPEVTNSILDCLGEYCFKGTFFVVGSRIRKYSKTLVRIVSEGHEVGNHSWSHPDFVNLQVSEMSSEINRTTREIVEICNVRPVHFRPPFGRLDSRVRDIVAELNLSIVRWNFDSLDWKHRDASLLYTRTVSEIKEDSILLFHDVFPTTARAVRLICKEMKRRAVSSVTTSCLRGSANTDLKLPIP